MVLIADDDRAARKWMVRALARRGHPAEEAASGERALALAARRRPTAAIIEVLLPVLSAYEVCRAIKDRYGAAVPVILVSARRTAPADRAAGLLLGADDYLCKPVDGDELATRLRHLLASRGAVRPAPMSQLTPREREVVMLLAEGLDQAEIAGRLVIAPRTVAKHVEHILGKLGVRNRAQAVAIALGTRPAEGGHQPGW